MKAYTSFSTRSTPVTEPIPGEKQVVNNTGGFVYELDCFKVLERFLLLGSESGSYYASAQKLTKDNALNTIKAIESDGKRAVALIVGISETGRAHNNDPAIFALALAASAQAKETRSIALDALPRVCRIGTHVFHFLTYVQQFRGWGRSLKTAVASWYNDKSVQELAYGVVKYQSRDGFSNADALRLSHPKTNDEARQCIYKWIVDGYEGVLKSNLAIGFVPPIIHAFETAKTMGEGHKLVMLPDHIRRHNLSREMLPTESLTRPEVWDALLERMPPHAMLRNLGNMSKVGLLTPLSNAAKHVVEKLSGDDAAKLFAEKRVHPIAILIAMKQYAAGHGLLGKGQWTPVPSVIDALNDAFYLAFKFAVPTGKKFLFGVDVSGSMEGAMIQSCNLTAAEGAAAMALACAKTEQEYYIMGFAHTFKDLKITPKMRLTDALKETTRQNFGSTDCALPMKWALENNVPVDCFCVITDNEVNTGSIHPKQTLVKYREKTGRNSKQIVMGMTATKFSIADPNDPFALDVAGFDANIPQMIQEFARL